MHWKGLFGFVIVTLLFSGCGTHSANDSKLDSRIACSERITGTVTDATGATSKPLSERAYLMLESSYQGDDNGGHYRRNYFAPVSEARPADDGSFSLCVPPSVSKNYLAVVLGATDDSVRPFGPTFKRLYFSRDAGTVPIAGGWSSSLPIAGSEPVTIKATITSATPVSYRAWAEIHFGFYSIPSEDFYAAVPTATREIITGNLSANRPTQVIFQVPSMGVCGPPSPLQLSGDYSAGCTTSNSVRYRFVVASEACTVRPTAFLLLNGIYDDHAIPGFARTSSDPEGDLAAPGGTLDFGTVTVPSCQ